MAKKETGKRIISTVSAAALILALTAACTPVEKPQNESQNSPVSTAAPMITEPKEEPADVKKASLAAAAPSCEGCTAVDLYCGGELIDYAYSREDGLYISPCRILALCGFEDCSVDLTDTELAVNSEDFVLHAEKDTSVICISGRYFYVSTEYISAGDRVFVPAWVLEKALNVAVTEKADGTAELNTADAALFDCGEDYYDVTYLVDDLYWLMHIIEAEAGNQTLEGRLGVGNVVINRVHSEEFPDTVYEVVFDYQGAPQFSPKMSTSLSWEVSELSKIAAYLTLEGYVAAKDCLYFQNPVAIETNWIGENREFALRIDDMDFYY